VTDIGATGFVLSHAFAKQLLLEDNPNCVDHLQYCYITIQAIASTPIVEKSAALSNFLSGKQALCCRVVGCSAAAAERSTLQGVLRGVRSCLCPCSATVFSMHCSARMMVGHLAAWQCMIISEGAGHHAVDASAALHAVDTSQQSRCIGAGWVTILKGCGSTLPSPMVTMYCWTRLHIHVISSLPGL
jgi:hypothetical protein